MYKIVESYGNPLVSDNYNAVSGSGLNNNGKEDYDYYINFNERDSDLMSSIYKRIEAHCFDYFNTISNGSWNGRITQLTHMESIKIITLYDIHVKELDLLASKQKLKDINNAIDNKQTRLY